MNVIQFVDLSRQYREIRKEVDGAIKKVVKSSQFILGSELEEFEKEFAKFCGVKYAIGVDSGLSALELGLRALAISTGDEVLTPANSFIGSSSSISFTGAKPVLVDCLENTFNIDVTQAERLITKKTRAIMPVHLYGQVANMEAVLNLARRYKLFVIEDACQAHGASYKNKMAGSFGDVATFSFYPGKNLGAYGDGGMVTTNNRIIAEKIKMLRNYGQKEKYKHLILGWNSRLDNLQAAILRVKLKRLRGWNDKRLANAKLYNKYLEKIPVVTPKIFPDYVHIFHLYVIRAKKRNDLTKYLSSKGITTVMHYPIPIHLQPAYKDLGYKKGDFPVTEKLAQEILSLPMFPEITSSEIEYICNQMDKFFSTKIKAFHD